MQNFSLPTAFSPISKGTKRSFVKKPYTVDLQRLEQHWNHEKIFETGVVNE